VRRGGRDIKKNREASSDGADGVVDLAKCFGMRVAFYTRRTEILRPSFLVSSEWKIARGRCIRSRGCTSQSAIISDRLSNLDLLTDLEDSGHLSADSTRAWAWFVIVDPSCVSRTRFRPRPIQGLPNLVCRVDRHPGRERYRGWAKSRSKPRTMRLSKSSSTPKRSVL